MALIFHRFGACYFGCIQRTFHDYRLRLLVNVSLESYQNRCVRKVHIPVTVRVVVIHQLIHTGGRGIKDIELDTQCFCDEFDFRWSFGL